MIKILLFAMILAASQAKEIPTQKTLDHAKCIEEYGIDDNTTDRIKVFCAQNSCDLYIEDKYGEGI